MNSPHETDPKTTAARLAFLADLRAVFDSNAGTAVLRWLHATAGTRKPSFLSGARGAAIDPIGAAICDGRKAIVWEIEANLETARALAAAGPAEPAPRTHRRARQQGG